MTEQPRWDVEAPVPLPSAPPPPAGTAAGNGASRPDQSQPSTGNGHVAAGQRRRPHAQDASSSRSTAADFTAERMLRPRAGAPERGWRRALYRATLGLVNVGPGPAELRRRELAARVKAPIAGSRRIVVLSRKGGVGKTTTTLMLGHTFASWRGDRVVALDGNPDAGSLAYRVRRETAQTVTGLLADAEAVARYADIRAFTSQAPTRLEVVASDDDPHITQALGEADYHRAIGLLDRHYNLILLDTGTGILDSGIQGILKEADQIVVVMPPALDGARVAASTLDWLDSHGFGHLVTSAVAVINSVRRQGLVEVARIEQHFAQRCAATVRIPFDPHLEAGAESSLEALRPATREAYLQLAAHTADAFATVRPQPARR
jgi:putative peptide zinc metalloprotease protein